MEEFTTQRGWLTSLINVAPVPNIVEVDPSEVYIELVKHAIIACSQFEFRAMSKALMPEVLQSVTHLVNPPLHLTLNLGWKRIEGAGKGWGPNLEGRRHGSLRLSDGIPAFSDFLSGPIEAGFYLIG